mmetsp:Transcript_29766/g.61173  ORF Transcript_29766/g.61173 Transcript_29766/m.61173 type:complete len:228 (+) Transcript_29766:291-974(+)
MPTLHSRRTSTWHALLRPSPRRKGNHSGRREWPRSSRLSRHRLPARTEPPLHLPLRPLLQPPLQPPSPLRVNIVDWNPDSPPTDLDITPQRVCLPALARMSTLESRRFHLMASPSCPSMRLFAQKAYLRVTPARQPSHLAPFVLLPPHPPYLRICSLCSMRRTMGQSMIANLRVHGRRLTCRPPMKLGPTQGTPSSTQSSPLTPSFSPRIRSFGQLRDTTVVPSVTS